ncbi:extensin-like [Haliotis rubra]|uniref:extensin-like n=1 Tax=Haliotis rubra TaxID=36100 RepID=UPI001EE55A2E|nr:extensin-like [Haliotis rubra]
MVLMEFLAYYDQKRKTIGYLMNQRLCNLEVTSQMTDPQVTHPPPDDRPHKIDRPPGATPSPDERDPQVTHPPPDDRRLQMTHPPDDRPPGDTPPQIDRPPGDTPSPDETPPGNTSCPQVADTPNPQPLSDDHVSFTQVTMSLHPGNTSCPQVADTPNPFQMTMSLLPDDHVDSPGNTSCPQVTDTPPESPTALSGGHVPSPREYILSPGGRHPQPLSDDHVPSPRLQTFPQPPLPFQMTMSLHPGDRRSPSPPTALSYGDVDSSRSPTPLSNPPLSFQMTIQMALYIHPGGDVDSPRYYILPPGGRHPHPPNPLSDDHVHSPRENILTPGDRRPPVPHCPFRWRCRFIQVTVQIHSGETSTPKMTDPAPSSGNTSTPKMTDPFLLLGDTSTPKMGDPPPRSGYSSTPKMRDPPSSFR